MLDYRQTLEEWSVFVIKIWIQKMVTLKVHNATGQNFAHHIISSANGDAARIEFVFNYVLKFTDMGVGKGIKYYKFNNHRIQKQWYTKTFLLEVKKLANIIAVNFAHSGVLAIVEPINEIK